MSVQCYVSLFEGLVANMNTVGYYYMRTSHDPARWEVRPMPPFCSLVIRTSCDLHVQYLPHGPLRESCSAL